MNQVTAVGQLPVRQHFRLSNVDWQTYSRLLHILAERPGLRFTYDRGELEIMSPSLEHDEESRFLVALIFVLAEELGLTLHPGGSTTLRRRLKRRGIEADECFWIANAPRLAGRRKLNLRTDPPPDLAIEVDVSHSSLDRLSIYAVLRVPEVWRLEGGVMTFYTLGADGAYSTAAVSRSFPLVAPADVLCLLQEFRQGVDAITIVQQFRKWILQRRASAGNSTATP